ncbi:MAG: MotA/TolQ/ExbB proton channel family protein [Candidatus Auribacterota bacterium]
MESFITLIQKGGFIMIPILLCSLLTLTIILERMAMLRQSRLIPSELVKRIQSFSLEKKDSLIDYCAHHANIPLVTIVKTMVVNAGLPHQESVELIKATGRQQAKSLDKGLFMLELIAAVTPLMGLLGTVLGMIDVFDTIVKMGVGQAEHLSAGISKALITTVAGLIVAIPSLAAYSMLSRKVEGLVALMDRHVTDLHGKIYGIHIER